ncbi:RusA family crossover junction endodeoxyribonuclease [Glutamicibacter arilaitensis]|uniref:RusA family crossover junction endodeoxyribonuclease n=1 Tax=Glutamicibacter arilaitensis TaxID=256701 RepID=UPI003FCFBD3F
MISFFVAGEPAPQGSKRHVGNGRMIESSKKLKPWRDRVTAVAKTRVLDEPLDGHLRLIVNFYMPAPLKSKFGSRPAGTPDLDKLVRAVGDALTQSKLIKDDARIVSLIAHKHWALDTPGAEITIERLPV